MKKYIAEWRGKKIVLDEDDYKKLLERFDLNNFVEEKLCGYNIYTIYLTNQTFCPLCKKHFDCQGCPFDLYPRDTGCVKIIAEVLEETIKNPFSAVQIYRNNINLVYNIEKGKRVVTLIRELLITRFKIVEE